MTATYRRMGSLLLSRLFGKKNNSFSLAPMVRRYARTQREYFGVLLGAVSSRSTTTWIPIIVTVQGYGRESRLGLTPPSGADPRTSTNTITTTTTGTSTKTETCRPSIPTSITTTTNYSRATTICTGEQISDTCVHCHLTTGYITPE